MRLESGPGCRPGSQPSGQRAWWGHRRPEAERGTKGPGVGNAGCLGKRADRWGWAQGRPGSHCEKHRRLVDAWREPRPAAHTGSGRGEGRAAGTEGGSLRIQVRLVLTGPVGVRLGAGVCTLSAVFWELWVLDLEVRNAQPVLESHEG